MFASLHDLCTDADHSQTHGLPMGVTWNDHRVLRKLFQFPTWSIVLKRGFSVLTGEYVHRWRCGNECRALIPTVIKEKFDMASGRGTHFPNISMGPVPFLFADICTDQRKRISLQLYQHCMSIQQVDENGRCRAGGRPCWARIFQSTKNACRDGKI